MFPKSEIMFQNMGAVVSTNSVKKCQYKNDYQQVGTTPQYVGTNLTYLTMLVVVCVFYWMFSHSGRCVSQMRKNIMIFTSVHICL